jgi:hypothetical protein
VASLQPRRRRADLSGCRSRSRRHSTSWQGDPDRNAGETPRQHEISVRVPAVAHRTDLGDQNAMAPEVWLRPLADRRVSTLLWQSRSSPRPFHPSMHRGSGPRPASACARWRKRGREQISERRGSSDTSRFADPKG